MHSLSRFDSTTAALVLALATPAMASAQTAAQPMDRGAPATTMTAPATTNSAPATPSEASSGTIVAAVTANSDLSDLGAAVTAAELADTLNGAGPFTVFAPTNEAFGRIAAATRTQLMQPANKAVLQTLLKYHVVAGNVTSAQLREQITAGGGTATLQTVAGQTLTAKDEGGMIVLTGENGSKAYVTGADQVASNGTVHVVNGVLLPRV